MFEQTSLRIRLTLVASCVLIGALLIGFSGMLLWITGTIQSGQRIGVEMLAVEFERVILTHVSRTGNLPPAETLQKAVHSRWVREAALLRISIFLPDGTTLVDTEPSRIGHLAPEAWRLSDDTVKMREIIDRAGQITYIAPIGNAGGGLLCSVALQLTLASSQSEIRRAVRSMSMIAAPMLIVSILVIAALCSLLARRILSTSLSLITAPPEPAGGSKDAHSDALRQAAHAHLPSHVSAHVKSLERGLHELQDLAAR